MHCWTVGFKNYTSCADIHWPRVRGLCVRALVDILKQGARPLLKPLIGDVVEYYHICGMLAP